MTRSQALAFNAGVSSVVGAARALAEDIRTKLPEDPERFPAAIAALEVIIEREGSISVPVPVSDETISDELDRRHVTDRELAEELAFLKKNRRVGL